MLKSVTTVNFYASFAIKNFYLYKYNSNCFAIQLQG